MEYKNEKVSFNVNLVDLGKIDLLVENGLYSNRTEFLKAAILHELDRNEHWMKQTLHARESVVGAMSLTQKSLSQYTKRTDLTVIGYLTISEQVRLEQLREVFDSIRVFGKVKAAPDIKQFYDLK